VVNIVTLTVGINTYISLADANTYFLENRIYADAWDSASDITREKALIEATKHINRQIWKGQKAIATQKLQFPRAIYCPDGYNVLFPKLILYYNSWYVEREISDEVKYATCEEALAILKAGSTQTKRAVLQAQGVKSFSVDDISETFSYGGSSKLMSIEAVEYMRKYKGGIGIC
jgi:hypothetical protein